MDWTRRLGLAATLVVGAVLCAPAHAVLITFEGQGNAIYSSDILRSGFRIGNVAGDQQHFHEITSTGFGLPNNGTGVLLNDRDTRIFVEEASGLDFSLADVDVASALGNNPADSLSIEGFLNGVSVGTLTVASLGSGYTTVLGASFGIIDRLVFDGFGGGGGFVLDNLRLNESIGAVPEPASLLLLGAGLTGMLRRRRRT